MKRTRSYSWIRLFLISGLASIVLSFAFSVWAANATLLEYKVKAAYLYNFLHFVEWPEKTPANKHATLKLLIVGDRAFHSIIASLEQRTIGDKKIEVTFASTLDSHDNFQNFHLIYLAQPENGHLHKKMLRLSHLPLLTVGEQPDFAEAGGMIGFVSKRGKVKFVVNRVALEKGHLTMRSKALRLAEEVID